MNGRILFAVLLVWCLGGSGRSVFAETQLELDEGDEGAPIALSANDFALTHSLNDGASARAFDFRVREESTNGTYEPTGFSAPLFVTEFDDVGTEGAESPESRKLEVDPTTIPPQTGPAVRSGQPLSIRDFRGSPPGSGLFKALGVGMFVVSGGDLASTELALSQMDRNFNRGGGEDGSKTERPLAC